jgi:UDP-N-acetylmuramate dehydrogenase
MSIDNSFKAAFLTVLKDRVHFDEPLAPLVAYRVGGPADVLIFPETEDDLKSISQLSKQFQLPVTVIGEGTNLLIKDQGIRGITVSLKNAFQHIDLNKGLEVKCGGGVLKADFLNWSISKGLSGLEFSSGVPGTIGGGIFMNAGTKYGCYGDILKELRLFDFKNGFQQFKTDSSDFQYRHQNVVKDSLVVWAVFTLKPGDSATIQAEVNRIIAERAEKQPLDYPSCGSTFKNPEGYSAGRLIEKTGLKGTQIGGAEISNKHANFILNKGNAKASDILALIELIQTRVWEQFSVKLEPEVKVLG